MSLVDMTGILYTPPNKALYVSTSQISKTSQVLITVIPMVRKTASKCALPELSVFHHANAAPRAAGPPAIAACTRKNEAESESGVGTESLIIAHEPKPSTVAKNNPKNPRANRIISRS